MNDFERCYRRNENFVYRRIEDETILVPIKDNVGDMGSIYRLNEMGAFIWEQLDGQKTFETVKDKILEEYDVGDQEVEADLSKFMTELIEIEAIVQVE